VAGLHPFRAMRRGAIVSLAGPFVGLDPANGASRHNISFGRSRRHAITPVRFTGSAAISGATGMPHQQA